MTDKEIVDLIIAGNEEAMLYLLYDRYESDLKFYAWRYYDSLAYLEDLINCLYIQFKGKRGDWQPLKSFQWKCKFRTWFCSVASHLFLEKKDELIKHSYQTYQSKFRIFCSWMEIKKLDKIHVSFITNQHIIEFLKYVSNHNQLSRRTVSKYRQMLHCFFEWLIRNKGVIDRNPVYGIPQIGKIKDESPCPIPDQEREVLKVYMKAKDPQLWLVCLFEYYCAIRPHEELRHLKIGDINFESHTITIRNDIAKNHLTETVDIPDQLFEEITKTYKLHEYPQDYYVFSLNRQPGPVHLGKSNFRNRFYEIRKVLGLSSKYKLYGFKHTGASKLVDAGASTWELQRHFRHKSITTTEAYFRKNLGLKSKKLKSDFPDI